MATYIVTKAREVLSSDGTHRHIDRGRLHRGRDVLRPPRGRKQHQCREHLEDERRRLRGDDRAGHVLPSFELPGWPVYQNQSGQHQEGQPREPRRVLIGDGPFLPTCGRGGLTTLLEGAADRLPISSIAPLANGIAIDLIFDVESKSDYNADVATAAEAQAFRDQPGQLPGFRDRHVSEVQVRESGPWVRCGRPPRWSATLLRWNGHPLSVQTTGAGPRKPAIAIRVGSDWARAPPHPR
jgi:hypothetical protein